MRRALKIKAVEHIRPLSFLIQSIPPAVCAMPLTVGEIWFRSSIVRGRLRRQRLGIECIVHRWQGPLYDPNKNPCEFASETNHGRYSNLSIMTSFFGFQGVGL